MRNILIVLFSFLAISVFAQVPKYISGEIYLKTIDTFEEEISLTSESKKGIIINEVFKEFSVYKVEKAFILPDPKLLKTYLIKFSDTLKTNELIQSLNKLDFIEYAEQVPLYDFFYTPNDLHPNQWNLQTIQAESAWDIITGSANIKVGMVDDAILLSHQDLQSVIWTNPNEIAANGIDDDGNGYIDDVNGWDAADSDNNPNPLNPTNTNFTHGTHCSGIAAASTDNNIGIASISSNVTLVPVKIGRDYDARLTGALAGVQYAIVAGVTVISMSWGGAGYSTTYQNVFNYAYSKGITCVAAAGNSSTNIPHYPSAYNHVVSVGSTQNGDGVSFFSNYGTTVDVMAPGSNIWSSLAGSTNSYGYLSGTSMACPLVSGLVALMLSKNPILTPDEIETCLKSSCDNIDAQNPSYAGQIGAGRVNAFKALNCVKPLEAKFISDYKFVCPNGNVQFTDQSTNNPTNWLWTFNGGTPSTSSVQNPLIQYATAGIYNVKLVVTNLNGTDSIITSSFIEVGTPSATISGNYSIVQGYSANLKVEFTGSSPWDFTYSDGTTSIVVNGVVNSPYYLSVSPMDTTTYTLISMNDVGCSGTFNGSGIINVKPLTVINDTICLAVNATQKISDLDGGFTAILDDSDLIGRAIFGIGDLNGDGIDDFVTTAIQDDDGGTDKGAAYILFMNSNYTINSFQKISDLEGGFNGFLDAGDRFGISGTSIGDLNGDGVTDIAIGAEYDDDGATWNGAIYILFMNANGTVSSVQKISDTSGNFLAPLSGTPVFGSDVDTLGDMDGDGVMDLIVGSRRDDDGGADRGAVYVLFMNTNGTVKTYQKISSTQGGFTGTLTNTDFFGGYLASLGDIDGDNVCDVVVTANQDDDGGTDKGAIYILFLNANGTVKANQKISDTNGGFSGNLDNSDRFGVGVCSIKDINGDGITDIAVAAINDDDGGVNRGAYYTILLNMDGTVKGFNKYSSTVGNLSITLDDNDFLGFGIDLIGDLDSDGNIELAVGALGDDDGGADRGAVWIIGLIDTCAVVAPVDTVCIAVGAIQKVSDTEGNFTALLDDSDNFGRAIFGIGDLNGDGIEDIVATSFLDDDGGTDKGAAYILFMDADYTVKSYQKISDLEGGFGGNLNPGDVFGINGSSIGDLNNDGVDDIAIGAEYDDDGGTLNGAIYILFMNIDGTVLSSQKISDTQGNFLATLSGQPTFGTDIDTLGDMNGDGVMDLVVSSRRDNDGGSFQGAVYVLFMNMDGTVSTYQKISETQGGFTGVLDATDFFGGSLASLGDIDGDNVCDIAVGTYADDDGGTDKGAVYILFLNVDGTVKSHQKISDIEGGFGGNLDAGDLFGIAICSVKDLNGDGITDVAVGARADDDGGTDRGAFYIIYLNSDGTVKAFDKYSSTSGNLSITLNDGDFFGFGIDIVGDLNSDGQIELAVGAGSDNDGGTDRGAVWIIGLTDTCAVFEPIICSISANFSSTMVCIGDSTAFTDLSSDSLANIISWDWDFGNGNSIIGEQNPKHLYLTADTFNVKLIVTNDNPSGVCFDTIIKSVIVVDTLTILMNNLDTICLGDSISIGPNELLCSQFPYLYNWLPIAGLENPSLSNPNASPTTTTKYYLTVTDNQGAVDVDSVEVFVKQNCCESIAGIGLNLTHCEGDTIYFSNISSAASNATYNWDFGVTANPSTYIGNTPPGIVFSSTGAITVRLILNDSCSTDTTYKAVNIFNNPSFNGDTELQVCYGDSVQLGEIPVDGRKYQWSTSYNLTDSLIGYPKAKVDSSLTYFITIRDTISGCSSLDSISVLSINNLLFKLQEDTILCEGQNILLDAYSVNSSYLWQDGSIDTTFLAMQEGQYTVTVINFCGTVSDTIIIDYDSIPQFNLGNDTILCDGNSLTLTALSISDSYVWNNGSTTSSITAIIAETYWADATNHCGTLRDSILIQNLSTPTKIFGNDTILCEGQNILLDANSINSTYLWQDGSIDTTFLATQEGQYEVTITNFCGVVSDTVIVDYDSIPQFDLGNDTILCNGNSIVLSALSISDSYLWNNGNTTSSVTAISAGIYWADATNHCGTLRDSILIQNLSTPIKKFGNDTILCEGQNLLLDAYHLNSTYLWQDGSIDTTFQAVQEGQYAVTITNVCGVVSDTINISIQQFPIIDLGTDTVLCNDTITLNATSPNASYYWSTAETDSIIYVSLAGNYWVDVTTNNCISVDTILIKEGLLPVIDFEADSVTVCGDTSKTVMINGNDDYFWSTGEVGSTINVDSTGMYKVSASNNCKITSDSIYVFFGNYPDSLSYSIVEICKGDEIQLSAENDSSTYIWNTGENTQQIFVSSEGVYNVSISNMGCILIQNIDVVKCTITLFIPTLITPNGDGKNDTWIIDSLNYFTDYTLEIYNRNGNRVFESTNYQNDWSGQYKGKKLPATSYYFVIDIPELNKVYKGAISIIYD